MPLNFDDMEQVGHVARLAVLAMCARGVAASEFEVMSDIQEMVLRVRRSEGVQLDAEIEFLGASSIPIGGMSL
jgi:hypothetical protein